MTLLDYLWTYQAGLTVLGAYALTGAFKVALGPERAARVRRVLPVAPVLLGALVGLVPGWLPGALGSRVVAGLVLGACAPMLRGVLKRRLGVEERLPLDDGEWKGRESGR